MINAVHPTIALILEHCRRHDPGAVAGIYLFGSATSGGLRPDSDLAGRSI